MKNLFAVGITLCLLNWAAAEEKKADNAKLAVGVWEVTATHEGGPPKGSTIEFTKDGKIKVAHEQGGMKMSFEGTYKIDGKKMSLKFKMGDNEETVEITIDKLDEKTFASTSKEGKVELARKK